MASERQIAMLGDFQARVDYALAALAEQAFPRRFWEKDPSPWKQDSNGEKVIENRLGWLCSVPSMVEATDEIIEFAEQIRNDGFRYVVLMGMGGNSLSPQVSKLTFGSKDGYPELFVLDSTDPAAIRLVESEIELDKTFFIASSKSGTTIETLSAVKYFIEKLESLKGDRASDCFAAITDPGTPLEPYAREKRFRKIFLNATDIGGRYSALSYYGIVPAAVIGMDIAKLLSRAQSMMADCGPEVDASDNPGVILGTIMAELAMQGRNKLTLICSPEIRSFGYWVEQLVAESTGKDGVGIVPVENEPVTTPDNYGDDRLFVYMRLAGTNELDLDDKVWALEHANMPVVRINLDDEYDIGREYFRWEIATGTACALLGVNAFSEPNVTESKKNTERLLLEYQSSGRLPEEAPVVDESGVKLFCDEETRGVLDKIRPSEPYADKTLLSYLSAYLDEFQPGDYFALLAFLAPNEAVEGTFQCMRGHLRDAYSAATTLGYGPAYLHSTGQLHKGGSNTGVFIQFTCDDTDDASVPQGLPLPDLRYSWSILKQAQAMGDAISLRNKGRRFIRLHLGADVVGNLNRVLDIIHEAVKEQPI